LGTPEGVKSRFEPVEGLYPWGVRRGNSHHSYPSEGTIRGPKGKSFGARGEPLPCNDILCQKKYRGLSKAPKSATEDRGIWREFIAVDRGMPKRGEGRKLVGWGSWKENGKESVSFASCKKGLRKL